MINLNNKKHIYSIAWLAGVLPVVYLMCNTSLRERNCLPNKPILLKLTAYLFAAGTYYALILLGKQLVIDTSLFDSKYLSIAAIFLLFMALQLLLSSLFLKISERFFADAFDFSDTISNKTLWFYFILTSSVSIAMTAYLFNYGPFQFTFSAIYVVANIYLYSQIKHVFKTNVQTYVFTTLFVIISSAFPISNSAFAHIEIPIAKAIVFVGYYYAPFILYAILLFLVWNGIKHSILLISKNKKLRSTLQTNKRIIALIILGTTLAIEIFGIFNFNNTRIISYKIELANKTSELKDFKIIFAADSHFSEITNHYFIEQFIDKINAQNADIIFFVGDIFESSRANEEMAFIQNQLKQIKSKYGVFAVEGNHENYNKINNAAYFANSNIELLSDTTIIINNTIQVIGRLDKRNPKRRELDELTNDIRSDLPTILLDHQPPNKLEAYPKADISLSGHTHNGQLFPLNFIVDYIYELSWGHQKVENTHFFVTCGAQGWGPQVKIGSRSEIVELNINSSTQTVSN
ncbi:metallophosphoesterase [Carboxylicivirga sp. N1Y90]|uniref:metallophosphoesterase n=1 Tax=Carboxylicivirga fragile TaxID=3417571 RepID=UPI003D337BC4|nr:metallophosphoesterase [Marinilabiliaceae bacterium N1Y90]